MMTHGENLGEGSSMASLREHRAERLLSIRELARRASVAPSTIYLIEAGRTIPRQRVARQLAEALHVDAGDIDEFRVRIEASKQRRPPPGTSAGASSGAAAEDGQLRDHSRVGRY